MPRFLGAMTGVTGAGQARQPCAAAAVAGHCGGRIPALFRRRNGAAPRARSRICSAEAGLDHLVFCGANRFGSAVQWLTGWPVTTEAVGVLTPGEPDAMFVQHVNHAPMARLIAHRAEVAWGGGSSIGAAIAVLEKRGAARRQGRRHRPDDVRAARHACGKIRRHRQSQSPLYAAAPGQVGGGNRLDADRRRADRSRHDGAARRPAAWNERARSRRSGRARLHRARRHQRHPFFRRHPDGQAASRRADAVRRQPQCRARRYRVRRDQRRVLGASRPGAAQLRRRMRIRQSSTATCTRSPMPRSMRWPRCSRTARCRSR